MKKKIILYITIPLAAIAIAIVTAYVYFANNPDIFIGKSVQYDENRNLEIMVMNHGEIYGVPKSRRIKNQIYQMSGWNNDVITEIFEKYEEPIDIKLDYRTENGKTIVTYRGTATRKDNKELENYESQKVFDFILVSEDMFGKQ